MNKRTLAAIMASTLLLSTMATAGAVTTYPAVPVTVAGGANNGAKDGLDMTRISGFSIGQSSEDGGMIEIVTYNTKAQCAYAVAGTAGQLVTIDMKNVTSAGLAGSGVDMQALVSGMDASFVYGDMSSLACNAQGTKLAVALQAEGYNDDGRVAIFTLDATGALSGTPVLVAAGKQPDAITFTPDGKTILVANEGEPRMSYTAEDPEGSITMIDAETNKATHVAFDDSQAAAYRKAGVLLMDNSVPSKDFEPEYIAADNQKAYIALQENNAIAVLDIASAKITGVYGLGLKDFGKVAADLQKNDKIEIVTHENVYGLYMPDGISMAEINGKTYLFTANEGDGREWGDEDTENFYCNEQKGKESPTGGVVVEEKITWFNPADYTQVLDQDKAYLYGGRSFSIYEVSDNGLTQVFDSGSDFETITSKLFPETFNCSNDDISLEDRSGKKGCEPEYTIVGQVGDKFYAFTGLERMGGIMAYDVTDPANATYVNYLNTRDYSADIAGDVAPEGLCMVYDNEVPVLLTANEVSGTMSAIALGTLPVEEAPEVEAPVAPEATVVTYTVQEGDTLSKIAATQLGDYTKWSAIYEANKGTMISKDMMHPGDVLVMPE